jgi:pyruvate,water dikinase
MGHPPAAGLEALHVSPGSSSPSFVVDAGTPAGTLAAEGGGKASNLGRMTALGLRVPPWFCVSARAFSQFRLEAGLPRLESSGRPLAEIAREMTERVLAAPMPAAVRDAVLRRLEAEGWLDRFLAVRSSGLDEDSETSSFAGQFASFLHQRGAEAVLDALRRCWASAFSERVLAYRRERGLGAGEIALGVVVQRMVEADVAGVAFSRDPVHPADRRRLLVSATWGLGEGLVSGAVDADHFHVDRQTLQIEAALADKAQATRPRAAGGIELVEVPAADRARAALTDAQVQEVAAAVLKLEAALGRPQDCEWAYAGGTLHLLQTRPITHLPPDAFFDPHTTGTAPVLWDNANIVESFCGVTTPLTFSHACRGYQTVYRQFCELMGVSPAVIAANEGTFRNMLGLIRGRIYYNLRNWYQLCSLFPVADQSQSFMETMMGVKQALPPALAEKLALAPVRHPPWSRLRLALVSLIRYARIDGLIARFEANLARAWAELGDRDLVALALPEQMALYHQLEDRILRHWQAPIVNDGRCMLAFGLLKALTEKWLGESGVSMNDLLCGQGDVESTEPTRWLMRIAERIDNGGAGGDGGNGDGGLRAWFLDTPPDEVARALRAGSRGGPVADEFRAFLQQYGFRCVDELKLEQPDLHQDPSFAVSAIASYVRMKAYSVAAMEQRERAIRLGAEQLVRQRLRGPRRWIYLRVLTAARRAVRDRERLRFARTRTFGLARRLFRAMAGHLVRLGVLPATEDIFYLTVEEIAAYIEGRPVSAHLGSLARLRREEFDGYRRGPPPPDRFITNGPVGLSLAYPALLAAGDLLAPGPGQTGDPDVLVGTSCCPGTVDGPVRVARSVADAAHMQGEILVTERTDPGWVPLFPTCSGLLIERGSLLSHSAVVARELGLPTIVGISGGLMTRLRTGQQVHMDAGRGEVRITR